jgi:hypothetical protein
VYSVENHAKWSAKDEWFYGFEELKRWKKSRTSQLTTT